MSRGSRLLATLALLALVVASVMLWPQGRDDVELAAARLEPAQSSIPNLFPTVDAQDSASPSLPSARRAPEPAQEPVAASWTFRGQVIGKLREPLELFGIHARRMGPVDNVLERAELPLALRPDGRFELSGLTPGHWVLTPFAPDHEPVFWRDFRARDESEWVYPMVPRSSRPERLEPASVAGITLLPSGEPAPDVEVTLLAGHVAGDLRLRVNSSPRCRSRGDGQFQLPVAPGAWTLVAQASDCNDAAPIHLVLAEGERRTDVRVQLAPPHLVRFWIAASEPSRPRPMTLHWFALGGGQSGTVTAREAEEFEVSLCGVGPYRWAFRCEPDALQTALFEWPQAGSTKTVRLERLAPEPVVLSFPSGHFAFGLALAADPALGVLPMVHARRRGRTTEFELPRPGRWCFVNDLDALEHAAPVYTLLVPAVSRHEDPGPQIDPGLLEAFGY